MAKRRMTYSSAEEMALAAARRIREVVPTLTGLFQELQREDLPPALRDQMGIAAFKLNNHTLAEQCWRKALADDPGDEVALHYLGVLHTTRMENHAAEESFKQVLRLNPANAEALASLSRLYNSVPLLQERWMKERAPTSAALEAQRLESRTLAKRPLVSLLLPVFNTPDKYLREALDSVLAQTYDHWELCIVDDASTTPHVARTLDEYARRHPRIRVEHLPRNLHIAAATNVAARLAQGEFIGFLDHDDRLRPDGLFECVRLLQQRPQLDFIYTDNCVIDSEGVVEGLMLKPDWSPEFFLCTNYVVHFCLYSRRIVDRVGEMDETPGYKGVQDVHIKARLLAQTPEVAHVRKVLYDWRNTEDSVASRSSAKNYVLDNAARVYQEALDALGIKGQVVFPAQAVHNSIGIYRHLFPAPRDLRIAVLCISEEQQGSRAWIKQVRKATDPTLAVDFHNVVVAPSGTHKDHPDIVHVSDRAELLQRVEKLDADQVVFLSRGVTPTAPDWLSELSGYLQSPGVGAVAGKVISRKNLILAGGYLFLDQITPLNGRAGNNDGGYWNNNVIAQNVLAGSADCLATSRATFLEMGGFAAGLGSAVGADYGVRLHEAGRRTVHNPWCECVLAEPWDDAARAAQLARVAERWAGYLGHDPFYPEGMSGREPFALATSDDSALLLRINIRNLATLSNKPGTRATPEPPPQVPAGDHAPAADTPAAIRDLEADLAAHGSRRPLKINFVLPPAPKITGGPLAILEYANRLIERGHDVSITTYPDIFFEGPDPFPWFTFKGPIHYKRLRGDAAFIERAPGADPNATREDRFNSLLLRILKMGGVNALVELFLTAGGLDQAKRDANIPTLLRDAVCAAYVTEVMPDCDLNVATFWLTAFSVFFSRKGKPVYFMQHYEEVFYPNEYSWLLYRLAVRLSYGLPMYKIANSSWLQKVVEERFGQRVPFSNNALVIEDFAPAPKLSSTDGIIRIVTYVRPEEWKGFGDAVEALRRVRERHGDRIEWHAFGYRNPLLPPDNPFCPYTFHEKLPFKELARLYATSDIALCPSWYESFPLPPLEAMASGTAVVTTTYGTEDYAFHEQNALTVAPRDVEAMAAAVCRLIEAPELREQLALAGRAMAETYDWDTAVKRRERLLYDIVDGKIDYDLFASSGVGLVDGAGMPFERAPADLELPAQALIRSARRLMPELFWLEDGARRRVTDDRIVAALGLDRNPTREFDDLQLMRIPRGSPIYTTADVVRRRDKEPEA